MIKAMSQWVLSVVQHVCQASLTPKSLTTIYANFDRLRGNSSEHQARVQEKEPVKVAKIHSIMSFLAFSEKRKCTISASGHATTTLTRLWLFLTA